MCNVAISTVLMYCFVTLVRLSLVTNKGYLLTYLEQWSCDMRRSYDTIYSQNVSSQAVIVSGRLTGGGV